MLCLSPCSDLSAAAAAAGSSTSRSVQGGAQQQQQEQHVAKQVLPNKAAAVATHVCEPHADGIALETGDACPNSR